jgi:hypothetical protein
MKRMNFIYNILFFIFVSFLGCGSDPILDRANEIEKENSSSKENEKVTNNVTQKEKMEIKPPQVVAPPTVEPPKPLSNEQVDPPPRNPKDGPFIKVSGEIHIDNWSGKKIRIDVFDGDQRKIGGNRPSVIISETLNKIGAYSIDLPQSEKELWVGAYIDEDEDGRPGPQDPSGWYISNPLSAEKNHSGITVILDVPNAPSPK